MVFHIHRDVLLPQIPPFSCHSSTIHGYSSLDHWVRARSPENWSTGKFFMYSLSHCSVFTDIIRSQQVTDNFITRFTYLLHTDWPVFQEACSSLSFGHSSLTLSRLARSSERASEPHYIYSRIFTLAYTLPWECALTTCRVTCNPRPVLEESSKRRGTKYLQKSLGYWLACGNTLRSLHGNLHSAASFHESNMIP